MHAHMQLAEVGDNSTIGVSEAPDILAKDKIRKHEQRLESRQICERFKQNSTDMHDEERLQNRRQQTQEQREPRLQQASKRLLRHEQDSQHEQRLQDRRVSERPLKMPARKHDNPGMTSVQLCNY